MWLKLSAWIKFPDDYDQAEGKAEVLATRALGYVFPDGTQVEKLSIATETALEPRLGTTRRSDPATSHQAAADNAVRSGSQRHRVLGFLEWRTSDGATDYEISEKLGLLRSSAAKRRGELTELGLVEDSGGERLTDAGSRAIVWRITKAGRSLMERIG